MPTIWKYLDVPRFVSLLATRRLWFAKASTFRDDPWEGFGKARRFEAIVEGPKVITAQDGDGSAPRQISVSEMRADFSRRAADVLENAREHLYVNSWCMGEHESMAMWEIYGSQGTGVAVRSSSERFEHSSRFAEDPSHYLFGAVKYHDVLESAPEVQRDFSTNIPLPGPGLCSEVLRLGLNKRSCYFYENEWRAVLYQDLRPDVQGVSEPFDLEQLIDAVYVGPRAPDFVLDAVGCLTDKFSLSKPVHKSTLLYPPGSTAPSVWR